MEYQFSKEFMIKRFRSHYRDLFPSEMTPDCKRFLNTIPKEAVKPVLIINPNDYMKQAFAYLFLNKGFVSYKVMSAYSLLDVYLGNSEDYQTVLDISPDVLCLYLGYGEFENKRQVDIVVQTIHNQVLQGKTVWIYCKLPSVDKVSEKFPGLVQFFNSSGYPVVCKQQGIRKLSDEL